MDKDLFDQVWQNLINNAIKYIGPQGTIHVEIETSSSFVKVLIRDSGQGIPEEALRISLIDSTWWTKREAARFEGMDWVCPL